MSKNWKISKKATKEYLRKFKDYNPIIAQMLFNRGMKDKKEAEKFLNPDYCSLYDPYLMKDIQKAVKRIIKALDKKETMVVFGDYDVDGITSTALLYKIIKKLGGNVSFYIPNRITEGYGLNKKAIDFLKEKGVDLIITVDNGISNSKEISWARKKGIDVVVTDHHEISQSIPKANAVIDPKQRGDKYPFKDLAGVGVAFKLAQALIEGINKARKKEVISEGQLKWYMDLVGLGTIADMVPLVDENRVLAHFGLLVLSKTKNVGLKSLAKVGGIDLMKSDPHTVGFQIGPRLNAAGRMAHAATALELLLSENEGEAGVLALRLERLNRERQNIVKENMEEIISQHSEKEIDNILLLRDKKWTAGIIGLIAGRMADHFSRPVFCMAEESGVVKGSVRSSVGMDVVETLTFFKKYFINYGGHKNAGGFSLKSEDIKIFEEKIVEYGKNKLKAKDLVSVLNVEKEIEFGDINKKLFEKIKTFEPFGKGNEEPVFATKKAKVMSVKEVGEGGRHLKLQLMHSKVTLGAIAFGFGEMSDNLYYGKEVDVAYKINENTWGDRKNLELKIEDLKLLD